MYLLLLQLLQKKYIYIPISTIIKAFNIFYTIQFKIKYLMKFMLYNIILNIFKKKNNK